MQLFLDLSVPITLILIGFLLYSYERRLRLIGQQLYHITSDVIALREQLLDPIEEEARRYEEERHKEFNERIAELAREIEYQKSEYSESVASELHPDVKNIPHHKIKTRETYVTEIAE
jgi:recombinational DNA repair ATPase RecF